MAEVTVQRIEGSAEEPLINVVFVHGLGSGPRSAWTYTVSEKEKLFWPDWLVKDMDGLAGYTVGYPADKMGWNVGWPLEEAAAAVLGQLMSNPLLRASAPAPIVRVCHSLGGDPSPSSSS